MTQGSPEQKKPFDVDANLREAGIEPAEIVEGETPKETPEIKSEPAYGHGLSAEVKADEEIRRRLKEAGLGDHLPPEEKE